MYFYDHKYLKELNSDQNFLNITNKEKKILALKSHWPLDIINDPTKKNLKNYIEHKKL